MTIYDEKWLQDYVRRTGLEPVERGYAKAKCTVESGFLPPVQIVKPKPVQQTLNPLALKVIRDGGLPEPIAEYKFLETRKFAFDFAWIEERVALEAEGHVHRIKSRFHSDIEKYNLALSLGWRVYRASSKTLRDPAVLLEQLRAVLVVR